jgi:hypothetical protein
MLSKPHSNNEKLIGCDVSSIATPIVKAAVYFWKAPFITDFWTSSTRFDAGLEDEPKPTNSKDEKSSNMETAKRLTEF